MKFLILQSLLIGTVLFCALQTNADYIKIFNPTYQGRPILAENMNENVLSATSNSKIMRANLVCQMAGYARAVENQIIDQQLVKNKMQYFLPESFMNRSYDWELVSNSPNLNRHVTLQRQARAEFVTQAHADDCSIALACRGITPNEYYAGTRNADHSFFKKCDSSWYQSSATAMVFKEVVCASGSNADQDLQAQLMQFHTQTKNQFALDKNILQDIGTQVDNPSLQCQNELTHGPLNRPEVGTCDYNEWANSTFNNSGAGSLLAPSTLLYTILSGRYRSLATSAPSCAFQIVEKYTPYFVKPEYFTNIPHTLQFCVDQTSHAQVTDLGGTFVCRLQVQGQDYLAQKSRADIQLQTDYDTTASPDEIEKIRHRAEQSCEDLAKCFNTAELSCPQVNFCPAPGQSADSAYRKGQLPSSTEDLKTIQICDWAYRKHCSDNQDGPRVCMQKFYDSEKQTGRIPDVPMQCALALDPHALDILKLE